MTARGFECFESNFPGCSETLGDGRAFGDDSTVPKSYNVMVFVIKGEYHDIYLKYTQELISSKIPNHRSTYLSFKVHRFMVQFS